MQNACIAEATKVGSFADRFNMENNTWKGGGGGLSFILLLGMCPAVTLSTGSS